MLRKIGLKNGFENSLYLRTPDEKPIRNFTVSIVICTYGRPESLNETVTSLSHQTFKDFEIIFIMEKGDLSALRDKGLKASIGSITIFLDDDVYCPPTWLQGIVNTFEKEGVVGVTGPTTIPREFEKNRDSIRYKRLRRIQEWLFAVPTQPGKLSVCGTPSMGSNFEGCSYEGEVDYLECCNMAVRTKEAIDEGGFDYSFKKTSEWCEVDLAMRLAKRGRLFFTPLASINHKPSKHGVYKCRLQTKHRWDNFIYFQRKWEGHCIKRGL